MFILDFDDTLFDTHAFKHARFDAMVHLKVPEEVYWETYALARNNEQGNFTYNDERHADILAQKGFDRERVLNALQEVSSQASTFLFDGAVELLEFLKTKNKEMILLSLGDKSYQDMKTRNSGVYDYFDRVFMVKDTKEHILKKIFSSIHSDEKVYFFNDKPDETAALISSFPYMRAVLKISPKFNITDYKNTGLPYFESLKEIEDYVRAEFA